MPRDAYFSFGEEEPDVLPAGVPPDPVEDSSGGAAVADPLLGGFLGVSEGPSHVARRGRLSLTPARLAALVALTLAVVLVGRALAGGLGGGSGGPDGAAAPRGVADRAGARVLTPSRPGFAAAGEARPRRQAAEQQRAQRRRSQTRRRARRHRERRPVERRDLSAPRAEPAPEASTAVPVEAKSPPPSQPVESEAPPAAQPIEVPATPQVPPSEASPPPAEPAPEPPGPPHIRDGAHSPEFGL